MEQFWHSISNLQPRCELLTQRAQRDVMRTIREAAPELTADDCEAALRWVAYDTPDEVADLIRAVTVTAVIEGRKATGRMQNGSGLDVRLHWYGSRWLITSNPFKDAIVQGTLR